MKFTDDSLGWLKHFPGARTIGTLGILIAFGHSILAMSGEESLAQINREIEAPKLKNLLRAGMVIFIYSLLLTSLVSFFAVMIIPDSVRMSNYGDDLIGGLAMFMIGPLWARLALRAFVVFVGFLILAGAVNTAIVGSTGVLTRVAEDGVLLDWFRHPHKKYGTNYRIVNMVAMLQIATIVLSRGDMFVLGEAYAFGVIWSFVFKTLSVLILRYKDKYHRLWRMPLNLKWFRPGGKDFPLGLALTFTVLFATAVINLFTKQVATISGVSFTLALFVIFEISEKINGQAQHAYGEEPEKFNLQLIEESQIDSIGLGLFATQEETDCDPRSEQSRASPSLPVRARRRRTDRAHSSNREGTCLERRRPDFQRGRGQTVQQGGQGLRGSRPRRHAAGGGLQRPGLRDRAHGVSAERR